MKPTPTTSDIVVVLIERASRMENHWTINGARKRKITPHRRNNSGRRDWSIDSSYGTPKPSMASCPSDRSGSRID